MNINYGPRRLLRAFLRPHVEGLRSYAGCIVGMGAQLLRTKDVVTWVSSTNATWYPPFSVLDAKQGYWQKRKNEWKEIGLDSGSGRDEKLLRGGLKELAQSKGMSLTGTSIFDPVLCEIIYNWFCPEDGIVYDPFAGGSVRGVVAEMLGRHYIGIDLSQRQVDANQINADRLGVCPAWHCDDSKNADAYLPDGSADLVFSCPPYHNLEKYSDHPLDLSNMNYSDFLDAYGEIIAVACRKLKEDRFAVFVVGEIRDNRGAYRDFVSRTKGIFQDCGLHLYNDMVLLNSLATAPLRAANAFEPSRKTVKVHQNVLVFYKGDMKAICDNFKNDFRWADLSRFKN